jgi:cobalamin biosynthesis protein CbiG
MNEPAIVALTPQGCELGYRLVEGLGRGEVYLVREGARQTLQELFREGRPLVCVMALGIVVRILGPEAQDKKKEPEVVAVDEAGRFAIAVLGGHEGANELATRCASALGAVPVITTASDVLGLPALDHIGRQWDWKIEEGSHLTAASAAVVRGEPIGVYQEAGQRDWWKRFGPWPASFHWLTTWPPLEKKAAYLVISDRELPAGDFGPTVIYRPPTLVLGVGCRRGVPCLEIARHFEHVCRTYGYAPLSLGLVATVSLKANELGLKEFVALHRVPLQSYTLEELAAVAPLPTPSEKVKGKIGIAGVSEPSAMLAAQTKSLLVPKVRGPRVTMALARRNEA